MATQSTKRYLRIRPDGTQENLIGGDNDVDAMRYAREGYVPGGGVEVTVGTPPMLFRKEWPKDEDWGDGKRGGASGATGRELDEAGMLGTGPGVDVREGTPSLVSRTPERAQDWSDGKMSGASNPGARGPALSVGRSSTSAGDADYLERLKGGATLPGKSSSTMPFGDDELAAMFEGAQPSSDEGDAELEAAQSRGQDTRLAASIGRAGAQFNESLTGAKYDRTAYDGYAADGDRPVGELLQRREAVAQRQGRARTAQQDRMRAEQAAQGFRRQQQQDARQAENDAYGRKRDAMGDARQAEQDKESARRFNLTRQDARAARASAHGAGAADKAEAARLKAKAAADADAVKRGEKLGQATSKAPFGDLQSALGALDGLSPGIIYGDAPEESPMGLTDRMLNRVPMGAGERFMDDKSIKYKSELQNLRDLITRARSGAAINESEEAHYLSLLGDDVLSDPRRAAAGINAVRRGIAQKLRDAQAAYAGPVLDNYEREGGTTYRNPVFAGQERAPPAAPVVMLSPDGRQYTVDPSEVDEAQQNGWRIK